MQPCNPGIGLNPVPHPTQNTPLIKSGQSKPDQHAAKLVSGCALGVVLQCRESIFKISSSLEWLYRYRFNRRTGEVINTHVYRRIYLSDDTIHVVRHFTRLSGDVKVFRGYVYHVFAPADSFPLIPDTYKVRQRNAFPYSSDDPGIFMTFKYSHDE